MFQDLSRRSIKTDFWWIWNSGKQAEYVYVYVGPTGTHKQAEDRTLGRLSSRGSEHKRTEGRHSPADSTSSG